MRAHFSRGWRCRAMIRRAVLPTLRVGCSLPGLTLLAGILATGLARAALAGAIDGTPAPASRPPRNHAALQPEHARAAAAGGDRLGGHGARGHARSPGRHSRDGLPVCVRSDRLLDRLSAAPAGARLWAHSDALPTVIAYGWLVSQLWGARRPVSPRARTPDAARAAASGRGASSRVLRIIGGTWRGRRFRFSAAAQIRPTPDRVRETLFNWLRDVLPQRAVLICSPAAARSVWRRCHAARRACTSSTVTRPRWRICVRALQNGARKVATVARVDVLRYLRTQPEPLRYRVSRSAVRRRNSRRRGASCSTRAVGSPPAR